MKIVIRTKKMIVALHNGSLCIFSVDALSGEHAIPKDKNTMVNVGRSVVGFVIDDDMFKRYEIFSGTELARMVTAMDAVPEKKDVLITKERLNELEVRNQRLCELEAAGIDNWKGF